MVPPLLLIFLVLGTIFIGVATPTEGGAMGAIGAMLLAWTKRLSDGNPARFSFDIVRSAARATAKLSSFVMFILIGARIFSLAFYGVNGHLWVEHLLVSLPGGVTGFLIFVNVLVFFLAFFLDFFELAFIVVPLLAPVAQTLGIDLIWFGVILAVNMQTSFMHPPFGFALFYLRSVAPRAPYTDKVTGRTMPPSHQRTDLLGRRSVCDHSVSDGRAAYRFSGARWTRRKAPAVGTDTARPSSAARRCGRGARRTTASRCRPIRRKSLARRRRPRQGLERRRSTFRRRRSSFGRLNRPWHRAALTRA